MKQDQETLGRYLRRERETRHVTVEEIALFIGINRPLVEALEADDFACFPGRGDCFRLVKQYSAYLNLDRTEVVRRFDRQWKMSAALKRYPKLTNYADDALQRKRGGFGGKKLFAGVSPAMMVLFSVLGVLLLVVPILLNHLPDVQTKLVPPEPAPPSGIMKKAISPSGERISPPAADAEIREAAPRRAPAIDPLYTPPGRAKEKPVPAPDRVRVVGNRDTKRYHLPGMKYYDRVKAYHRVIFQTEREALRAGYVKARE